MQQITNFAQAHAVLSTFILPHSKYALDRMHQLMHALGDPQNSFKVIHVAGTSGKTSTCYYVSALLQQAGSKVGMTVSPHVDEVNERLQINLKPLPEEEFCQKLSEFLEIVDKTGIKPTYFELLIAFAYWEFARQKVDYAVVEVGLGGLLDGTNVVKNPGKVCVITDIGLDHTNVLGKDLGSIAAQKAGIITSHNPVFTSKQDTVIMDAITKQCAQQHAQLFVVDEVEGIEYKQIPLFQRHNFGLASKVAGYIAKRDGLPKLSSRQLRTAALTHIPARMELVERDGKTIILDGAHNPQKLYALVSSIKDRFPNQKFAVLIGVVSGKDTSLAGVMQEVLPIASHVIATGFSAEQDLPRPSVAPGELASAAKTLGFSNIEAVTSPEAAYQKLLGRSEEFLLVTGSFYLLNHIRPHVLQNSA
jgi:dihydrofolate synthase/folylpolyglutamate synthase